MKLFFLILSVRMKLDLTPINMREKDLQLLDRQSENSAVSNPEQSREKELENQVMSVEAHKYYVLGQVRAYMDMVREDVDRVAQVLSDWRNEVAQRNGNSVESDLSSSSSNLDEGGGNN